MTETPVLVVGGAGYIGSHTCLALPKRGFLPIVYDNLTNGHGEFVKWGPLEQGDIRDRARWTRCWPSTNPRHFALRGPDRGGRIRQGPGRLL